MCWYFCFHPLQLHSSGFFVLFQPSLWPVGSEFLCLMAPSWVWPMRLTSGKMQQGWISRQQKSFLFCSSLGVTTVCGRDYVYWGLWLPLGGLLQTLRFLQGSKLFNRRQHSFPLHPLPWEWQWLPDFMGLLKPYSFLFTFLTWHRQL